MIEQIVFKHPKMFKTIFINILLTFLLITLQRNIVCPGNPLSYFSFQPVLHDWCNKGHGMCYPVCRMMHVKQPLLLIDKSSLCDVVAAGFLSHYQSGPLPYA